MAIKFESSDTLTLLDKGYRRLDQNLRSFLLGKGISTLEMGNMIPQDKLYKKLLRLMNMFQQNKG